MRAENAIAAAKLMGGKCLIAAACGFADTSPELSGEAVVGALGTGGADHDCGVSSGMFEPRCCHPMVTIWISRRRR